MYTILKVKSKIIMPVIILIIFVVVKIVFIVFVIIIVMLFLLLLFFIFQLLASLNLTFSVETIEVHHYLTNVLFIRDPIHRNQVLDHQQAVKLKI